jgi:hypothetical protein
MSENREVGLLKELLREQLCCLGRIFARHKVADDVIWEVVKGFDIIYQKVKLKAENAPVSDADTAPVYKMEPHPGLTYLLEKIEKQTSPEGHMQ